MPETITDRIRRFFHRDRHTNQRTHDEAIHLLTDPFSEDGEEAADRRGVVTLEGIRAACRRMQGAGTKRDLLQIIAGEVSKFDLHDLETIYARFERRVDSLPAGYRDRLLASVRDEILAHHRLILLSRNGSSEDWLDEPPGPLLDAYSTMLAEACTAKAQEKDAGRLYLNYLPSAFTMFVMEEPAHPIGTPFPGGQIVDEWEMTYLCPYCPAVQSTEPTFPETRARRLESLANYWTNYKG